MKDILLRLQNALIESTSSSRKTTETGAFMVMLTPDDPLVWINYAVPTAEASLDEVDEMIQVFRDADRTPRLEFFLDLWPGTTSALDAKGFVCEKRMPIMVLKREDWQGLAHAHDVRPVDADAFHAFNHMLGVAFGMVDPAEPIKTDDPLEDRTYQRIASGETLAVYANIDDRLAGGGLGVGTREIREIAGIGTVAEFRKRGIASAVIATLLDRFFAEGGEIAWLTPGDDTAQSVYTNLGFQTIAESVVYGLPSEATA